MIGIVGPHDSTDLVLRMAEEEGAQSLVTSRSYAAIDQIVDVARELDKGCNILLFTGRVPFILATRAGGFRARLDHIPHAGADLYRALVEVMVRTGQTALPQLSVDSIKPDVVTETFSDLELDVPRHMLDVDDYLSEITSAKGASAVADFHAELFRSGATGCALTCLAAVHELLTERGIPTLRISHTPFAAREGLRRALIASEAARHRFAQVATGLVEVIAPADDSGSSADVHDVRRRQLRLQANLLDYAERMRGTMSNIDDRRFILHTTRGVVEGALDRLRRGHASPIVHADGEIPLAIGYGLGSTAAEANDNARRALALARRDRSLRVVFPDGTVFDASEPWGEERVKASESQVRGESAFGLGSLSLKRLTDAFRKLDPDAVTASQLADAYGIKTRSARRLLSLLEESGVATLETQASQPGPGRPRNVYRIRVQELMAAVGSARGDDQ